ncbi:hypothetical protein [Lactobacillus paragasseri]|uniref:hypothetical protein n=1 Tax=Lactobacillus paragasseri TaxID=2107999 RepID=UPI0028D7113C|nr:hypothetical protein [Lactobacillus paragasseri]
MIFLNNLKSFKSEEIKRTWESNPSLWIILIVIGIVSLLVLILWFGLMKKEAKDTTQPKYDLKNIKRYDSEILNYFVTFIIPILSLDPKSLPSIVMNLLLVVIEGIYYISNNVLYFNVILLIAGFHVYSAEDEKYIIVSRKSREEIYFGGCVQIGTTNIFYC